ncbi:efflux RND transporter periplasmic adaptor subunit [Azovibrio restrictus]|uniref:efflux RND transporter periplasmic adaptor subunit n=1 Tax=Azovibrio restrictus TaxID=146938 RepID=UPI0026ED89C5|nr:efflux RND transporter periplasmic adaptor subunit [Azovibrio restrictus]MDD3483413.1 efflux RND transporter periplasmic adaptor subunit [Azovibrio restrictus]
MPQHNNKVSPVPTRPLLRLLPLALSSALALAACSGSEAPQGPAMGPLPVTVLEMQPQRVPNAVEIMAQTEGAKETEVRARVGGILMKQLYQEGQSVKAGQPLFQIDRSSYEISYAEAKARADQTERELARLKKLLEVQGVSRKEYDDGLSANDVAQAALRQAQLNLSWTTVTAPVDGVTGRAEKSVGNLITTGTDSLLTTVYQNDPMWVRFSLAESEAAKLPGGRLTPNTVTGVELVLADGSVYPHQGKLNFLASSIDTTLGTQQLRAEFSNKEGQLLPGQFVRVRLLAGDQEGVYLVPQSAVLQTEKGSLVMVADAENKVAPRPVKTGEWLGKDWVVLGGLNPGDKVITDNLMKLKPGAPVAPHAPGAAPGAPAAPAGAPAAAPAAKEAAPAKSEAAPDKQG